MRKKKNLKTRLEKVNELLIPDPLLHRGHWHSDFPDFNTIHVELGCGKGKFTVNTALNDNSDALFIALERIPDAAVVAMERALNSSTANLRFIISDASMLCDYFANGELDRIYINFCDPWPARKHAHRRLTSPGFLKIYKHLLRPGGQIFFKTDNKPLFDYSVRQLADNAFLISDITGNLHKNAISGFMTDYEERFYSDNIPICRLVATSLSQSPSHSHS